uniref:VPS9 domain-containing protein n=1 Tax=Macrostomum lignano TaxID=282301 RepID=A0A1I8JM17_9PLAT
PDCRSCQTALKLLRSLGLEAVPAEASRNRAAASSQLQHFGRRFIATQSSPSFLVVSLDLAAHARNRALRSDRELSSCSIDVPRLLDCLQYALQLNSVAADPLLLSKTILLCYEALLARRVVSALISISYSAPY